MTAPRPVADDVRAVLAEVVAEKLLHSPGNPTQWCLEIADALLPAVAKLCAQARAEVWDQAADELREVGGWIAGNDVARHERWRARARALRAEADGEGA